MWGNALLHCVGDAPSRLIVGMPPGEGDLQDMPQFPGGGGDRARWFHQDTRCGTSELIGAAFAVVREAEWWNIRRSVAPMRGGTADVG